MSTHRIQHGASRTACLAVALLLSGLLAGCGSGDATAGPTTTSEQGSGPGNEEICDIVSDDAVAAVLDAEVVRREPFEEPGTVGCTKGPEQTSIPHFVNVYVLAGVGIADMMDGEGAAAPSQPVGGLGDRALFLPDAGSLLVEDGDDTLSVQVFMAGVPGGLQDCTDIAEDMLDRRS